MNNDKPFLNYEKGDPIAILKNKLKLLFLNKNYNNKNIKKIKYKFDKLYDVNNNIFHFPNIKKMRECIYVSGCSGAGKSYWIGEYGKIYSNLFKENNIILFSKKKYDAPLDKIKDLIRIPLNEDLYEFDLSYFSNSLVIFDDVDNLRNSKIKSEVYNIISDILTNGRSEHITIIITSHLMTNYKETRIILNECPIMVFFPKSGNDYQIKNCLKTYFGLMNKQINKIFKINSRWVLINKSYPQYILYNKGCYLL